MTRLQMLTLLNKDRSTLNALLIAIAKWAGLKHHWKTVIRRNSIHYPKGNNCSLCELYFKAKCRGCPLGSCDHRESPWNVTTDAIESRNYCAFSTGVDMMLYILNQALEKEISENKGK